MNSKEVAKEIVEQYHVFPEKSFPEIEAIAKALTQARDEALEEAAKVTLNYKCHKDPYDKKGYCVPCGIQRAIRSLKRSKT